MFSGFGEPLSKQSILVLLNCMASFSVSLAWPWSRLSLSEILSCAAAVSRMLRYLFWARASNRCWLRIQSRLPSGELYGPEWVQAFPQNWYSREISCAVDSATTMVCLTPLNSFLWTVPSSCVVTGKLELMCKTNQLVGPMTFA